MGAIETAAVLGEAEQQLVEAVDCTDIGADDLSTLGQMLGASDDLRSTREALARDHTGDWDGPMGLSGAEEALTQAQTLLATADDGENGQAIAECIGTVAHAKIHAEEARTLFAGIEERREELVARLAEAQREALELAEMVRSAADRIAESCTVAMEARDKAAEIAEKLQAAVS